MDPSESRIFHDAEIESPVVLSKSFEVLNLFGSKLKRMHSEIHTTHNSFDEEQIKNSNSESLSILNLMKLARAQLLELNSKNVDFSRITLAEEIDVAMVLQASAQQVAKKIFISARKLLSKCQSFASHNGTPFQRVCFYFAEALYEKMDRDWGFIKRKEFDSNTVKKIDALHTLITLQPARVSCEQDFSTSVVCQYASIQSILDNMCSSKKVHLIDLRIKNGSHWTTLIQALGVRHGCPVELLKITAIGTSKEILEETGKRLSGFAEAMNVPFCFKIVLSELKEIKKDMFQIEGDETLAIYSSICLWSLLAWPDQLEKLSRVIKDSNPHLVLINELEASLNSSVFLERFTETLLYFSVVFDCLKITLENRPFRKLSEEIYIKDMIRNAIASEGKERIHRYEKAKFWRTLLEKYGFVETELSSSALDQARFLVERSGFGRFFSIETDGKCLKAGWKGTPLEFVSVFRLQ